MNGAINFDHLHDVIIFAVTEKVDRDLECVLAEQVKLTEEIVSEIIEEDNRNEVGLDHNFPSDEDLESLGECRCDGCENNLTGFDCPTKAEPYLSSQGQMIYPECDHLNGYCKGEDNCTEPGFPGKAE
jgi:hypothetical protein